MCERHNTSVNACEMDTQRTFGQELPQAHVKVQMCYACDDERARDGSCVDSSFNVWYYI